MGAPRFKPAKLKRGSKSSSDHTNDKRQVENLRDKINQKLKDPTQARKAAQILTKLLDPSKKK